MNSVDILYTTKADCEFSDMGTPEGKNICIHLYTDTTSGSVEAVCERLGNGACPYAQRIN